MIKTINFNYRTEKDLLDAKKKLGEYVADQVLFQIFTCHTDIEVIKNIRSSILEVFPSVAMIGASTAGEIFEGEAVENSTIVSIMKFENTKVKTYFLEEMSEVAEEQIKQAEIVGDFIKADNLKATIMFCYGVKRKRFVNVLPFLSRLKNLTPDAIFSGGVAGIYGFNSDKLSVTFTESNISNFGMAIASLYSDDLYVTNKFNLSWVPIGKKLVVQDVDGYHLKLLDGVVPREIYRSYLGDEVIEGLPISAGEFPLVLHRSNQQMIIHPAHVYPDGTIEMTHKLHVGEQLRFSYCHVGLLALSANRIFNDLIGDDLQANFIYSCAIRKNILGEDVTVELKPMAELSPSAGFFAYGEFYDQGVNEYHRLGQTTTVLGLREGPILNHKGKNMTVYDQYSPSERRQFKTMRVLHRLIEKSASDLELSLVTLAQLAHKDALTGLYNRRYFDIKLQEELKRQSRANSPLSLILMDIDFFKNYNDLYGHVAGDDALRGVGQCLLMKAKRTSDIAARYGGEEMVMILPETDVEGARVVADNIRELIMSLELVHEGSDVAKVLTMSIGFITLESNDKNVEAEKLVEACDKCLYEAKESGRNKVVGRIYLE